MRSATGRWVTGDDFHGRDTELRILARHIREGNHILLSGQRRMGKTSIARELGRRLENEDWAFIFADVEHATSAEDVIAELARGVHPLYSSIDHFIGRIRPLIENIEEISVADFRVRFRAQLNAGNWRRLGDDLLEVCVTYNKPVLVVIDELPIFLSRLARGEGGLQRVDEFLSWMRRALQNDNSASLVAILSGSIGLPPLLERLGIPDRINHLYPFRLEPWNRDTSISCFQRLSESNGINANNDVAGAVYDTLGSGIPHFVQRLFAHLRNISDGRDDVVVTKDDVVDAYRTRLLGPEGQGDLIYYEIRLREALDDETYAIAMEILAEASTQDVFTREASGILERFWSARIEGAADRIRQALGVLEHDGYLQSDQNGHHFSFHLLKEWWSVRFQDHHVPLSARGGNTSEVIGR